MTLGEFFYKLTFKPPFRQVKEALRLRSIQRRHEAWCRWYRRERKCLIHPSIELRDDRPLTRDNIALGYGVVLERDVTLWLANDTGVISLGNRVFVGRNCYLGAVKSLIIGADTLIGAYSYIITADHGMDDLTVPVSAQGYRSEPVVIGADVWIGAHVKIRSGVSIGDRAVIGMGAVVTKDVPPGEIWAGVPARRLGLRGVPK